MPSEDPVKGPNDPQNGERDKGDTDHKSETGTQPHTSEQPQPAAPDLSTLKKADMGKADAPTEVGKEELAHKPETETGRRPSEWFMIFLTFLIACATIVNVWVFYKESEDAGAQTATLANKAAEIVGTMNTALSSNQEAIHKAFENNRLALESSQQQSKRALDASIEVSRREQRAWVGVDTPVTLDYLSVTPRLVVVSHYSVKNFGRGPAYKVMTVGFFETDGKVLEGLRNATCSMATHFSTGTVPVGQKMQMPPPLGYTLFPNQLHDAYIGEPNDPWSGDAQPQLKHFWFVGCVAYLDQFHTPRWTSFCVEPNPIGTYAMDKNIPLRLCSQFNDTDDSARSRNRGKQKDN